MQHAYVALFPMWTVALLRNLACILTVRQWMRPNWCPCIYVQHVMQCLQACIALQVLCQALKLLVSIDLSSQPDHLAKQIKFFSLLLLQLAVAAARCSASVYLAHPGGG